ncbi:hypothetical protein [Dactylosporangium sp. NPDC000521]|uniref:hypothetical protein n=1 Tax=Dactylosporangium sp. NPDC000521 TaxID=3363975 RepID=UPI00367601E4
MRGITDIGHVLGSARGLLAGLVVILAATVLSVVARQAGVAVPALLLGLAGVGVVCGLLLMRSYRQHLPSR